MRDNRLVFTAAAILLLPICMSVLIRAVAPDRESGTGPEQLDFAECVALDEHVVSPDGQICAVVAHWLFLASRDGRSEAQGWVKWTRWVGWTADSRYAIYEFYDQYGNSTGWAFDTERWAPRQLGERVRCRGQMSGECVHGVRGLASVRGLALLKDGVLVDLATFTGQVLPEPAGPSLVPFAAWSPDERQLLWVGMPPDGVGLATAYLAAGDGSAPRPLPDLAVQPEQIINWRLDWAADTLSLDTGAAQYRIDRRTGATHISQVASPKNSP